MTAADLHHVHRGSGRPLLLIHGLGSSWRSWDPVLPALSAEREVIAVDLPGFGDTPPLVGEVTISTLADALEGFLNGHDLDGVDVVGSSMGARLALELARRRRVGAVVSLDPGGFWTDRQRRVFGATIGSSVKLVRALAPVLPLLVSNPVGRTLLLGQFSARPWALDGDIVLRELRGYSHSPSLDAAFQALVHGPAQAGMAAGTARGPIVIGWGRRDLVCLPSQAARAGELFPDARVHWFESCGHFPQWDVPDECSRLILDATASSPATVAPETWSHA
ncbi:pimeloyl-ACP methyl ester carboxylesterase [Solirubrobacter pauli]|uniref:Pimeloyl-ACP methyl ester carboxylesterase n=1 Tax=Solirubrobacter pauli TaxID=166793 RepID=A0A660L579_9ACTN|nr:alpha/beta fold hydrolase [Solirubrobacter pauli]RKQ88354.1 pimeloyl-ACP methyl ester carboxylesterase [Solirubrobacter pauli]